MQGFLAWLAGRTRNRRDFVRTSMVGVTALTAPILVWEFGVNFWFSLYIIAAVLFGAWLWGCAMWWFFASNSFIPSEERRKAKAGESCGDDVR